MIDDMRRSPLGLDRCSSPVVGSSLESPSGCYGLGK